VTAAWLQEHPDEVVIVDAQTSKMKFERGHIPGAIRAQVTAYRLNNRVPSVDRLALLFGRLGIDADTPVVIYDDVDGYHASWAWFVLQQLGHEHVALLNGGLEAFRGRLQSGEPLMASPKTYKPRRRVMPDIVDAEWVASNLKGIVLIDARPPEEYTGEKPKRGSRPGHIPGAMNIPWTEFRRADGQYLSPDAGLEVVSGIPKNAIIVVYSNTFVAGAHVFYHLRRLGFQNVKAFEGSIFEWQTDPKRPLKTGEAP
jgi:thiosulfate/3-mercaptopyruvate sulfurtransferase